jgi:predicted RNA methylase
MTDYSEAEAKLYHHTHQLLKAHETLLRDANRNRPFYRALKHHISPDMSVLDIGSGTGLWAIAAARMGAKRVVAIEAEPLLVGLVQTLARDNGVADRVEVVHGHSTHVQLAREFDLIITETIGHVAFEEQIVPTLIDARARFLKPGGVLIPESVALMAAAAHLKFPHKTMPAGIPVEYSSFETLALNTPIGLDRKTRLTLMSPPAELIRVDLATIQAPPNLTDLTARWTLGGTNGNSPRNPQNTQNKEKEVFSGGSRVSWAEESQINCFAVWAEATLTNSISLTTRRTTSWSPVIYRIKPFTDEPGDIEFRLTLTNASNFWTATLSTAEHQEAQSYSPVYAATTLLAATRTGADVFSHLKRIGLMDVRREAS